MADDIGKCLLRDTEQRGFHLSGQPPDVFDSGDVNSEFSATSETSRVLTERGSKSGHIENGRMKQIGTSTKLTKGPLGEALCLRENFPRPCTQAASFLDRGQGDGDREHVLRDTVV